MIGNVGAARSARLSAYPEIHRYGLIGNCRTAALVSDSGVIEWCAFPRFDSPSVFASVLDRRSGGEFAIIPAIPFGAIQRYVDRTNVLETRFRCATGRARLHDCFTLGTHEILRVLEGLEGEMDFEVRFNPRPRYSRGNYEIQERKGLGIRCEWGNQLLVLRSSLPRGSFSSRPSSGTGLEARFRVRAGEKVVFSLSYSDEAPAVLPPLGGGALQRLAETVSYWKNWSARCTHEGPYRSQVLRSALALKLMTFGPSGAVISAPSTSLPEAIGGTRNWDYRYCWLRDASSTIKAFCRIGYVEEALAFAKWLIHSTSLTHPRLQPLYSVYGLPVTRERTLDWLDGYRSARPVRVGNAAYSQKQLHAYGEVCLGMRYLAPVLGGFDRETRRFLIDAGRTVLKEWREPDQGIWELRSMKVHNTLSKVMSCVALEQIRRMEPYLGSSLSMNEFGHEAALIRELIERRGYNRDINSYVRVLDGTEVDASLLLLPPHHYCAADSPRMIGTYRTVTHRLSRAGLIYRYAPDEERMHGGKEGAFTLCSFWMAEALALSGRVREARVWIDTVLSRASPLGLWAEELDPSTGELLGNYPQADAHIGLINAALSVTGTRENRADLGETG